MAPPPCNVKVTSWRISKAAKVALRTLAAPGHAAAGMNGRFRDPLTDRAWGTERRLSAGERPSGRSEALRRHAAPPQVRSEPIAAV